MANLQVSSLLNQTVAAAQGSLSSRWPQVKELATNSFRKLSQVLVDIEKMKLKGAITEEQARLLFDMEKNTLKIVLLSVEILGILAVEAALNAALNVIKKAVNTALGFTLIV